MKPLLSPTRPSEPSWSSSCDVRVLSLSCTCLFVPFPCVFLGLSWVLWSHDQFEASHWSALPTPLPPLPFLFKFVSVPLSASVERVGFSRMRDFLWEIGWCFFYCLPVGKWKYYKAIRIMNGLVYTFFLLHWSYEEKLLLPLTN